jgi:hypothetical protein
MIPSKGTGKMSLLMDVRLYMDKGCSKLDYLHIDERNSFKTERACIRRRPEKDQTTRLEERKRRIDEEEEAARRKQ